MIYLEIQRLSGIDRRDITVEEGAGIATGTCPGCGCHPFVVAGHSVVQLGGGRSRSCGQCLSCADPAGHIYAEPDTIFGAEEDRVVLDFGRARVYGGTVRS